MSCAAPLGGVGLGLRAPHYRALLAQRPALAFLEVNSENFFGGGGQPFHFLEQLRAHYPLSLHGVGLSLGSTDELSAGHLARLSALIDRVEPALVSDHLCWSSVDGDYVNDLLPLPYTEEALAVFCANVIRAQDVLHRRILVENVSSYVEFQCSTIPEWEFLDAVAARTGCGILLDVNNIHVSAANHGFDPVAYVDAIPRGVVGEIHVAGFESAGPLLIDTHGAPVADPVWALFRHAVARFGSVPTLIERDTDIPRLEVMLAEVDRAASILCEGEREPARAAA